MKKLLFILALIFLFPSFAHAGRGFGATLGVGTTDKLTVGNNSSINNLTQLTISVETYRNGDGGNGAGRILQKADNTNNGDFILYNASGFGAYYGFIAARWGGNGPNTNGSWYFARPSANARHNIIVTYDYGSVSNVPAAYVDGVSQTINVDTTPQQTPQTYLVDLVIGNRGDNGRNWDGCISRVRIWNRILTAGEITTASGNGAVSSGLVAQYNINGTDSPELDTSGNGNNALVNGTAACTSSDPAGGGTTTTTTTVATTTTTVATSHVGFNFRGTQAGAIDGAGENPVFFTTTYSAAQGYGWQTALDTCGDATTAGFDRRLSGACGAQNINSQAIFQADAAKIGGLGNKTICLALGSPNFAHAYQYVQFLDNTTPVLTIDAPTGTQAVQWLDANQILRSNTTWPTAVANGTACTQIAISTGPLIMKLGTPTNQGGDDSTISHFSLDNFGGTVTTTTSTTTTTTTVATTTTTLPTYDSTYKACWGQVTADINNNPLTPDFYTVVWGPYPGFYTNSANVGLTATPSAPCVSVGALGLTNGYVAKMSVIANKTGIGASANSNELQFNFIVLTTTTTATTTTLTTIQGQTTTTTTSTTTTTLANHPPAIVSFNPGNVTADVGGTQSFTAVVSDADGYGDINIVSLNISGGGNSINAQYFAFDNSLSLTGSTNLPNGCHPGDKLSTASAYLTLDCSKSTVSGAGNNLTVTFNLTTSTPFADSTYKMVVLVQDKHHSNTSGIVGTWTVNLPQTGRTRTGRTQATRSQTNRSRAVR